MPEQPEVMPQEPDTQTEAMAEDMPPDHEPILESEAGNLEDAMRIIAKLQVELREARQETAQQQDLYVRLNADFANFRRRKEKEALDMIQQANRDLILQLLPILDNFDRTLDAIEKTDNLSAIKEGIALVNHNLLRQFQKAGLERIESKGQPFDANLHEAVTSVPVADDQKGLVVDEAETGYKLKEKVIRFAKVIVGE
ncbi:MAG: nucleotide exchange factor GrpE [Bacteroidia bacterium]|nr:nucleotide exchange factor GrpE [Bacteroidia bacterium]